MEFNSDGIKSRKQKENGSSLNGNLFKKTIKEVFGERVITFYKYLAV